MPAKPSHTKFNNTIKKLARSVRKQAEKEAKSEWKLAYIDVRSPSGGGSRILKYRIERLDGSMIKTLHTSDDQDDFVRNLFKIKGELFEPRWYGIKITVFPDGRFDTEFNHDPHCTNDPNFYDFDK